MLRRCAKCIMPETAKGIKFDENGICQLCRDYKEFVVKGETELRREIKPYIDVKGDYNCVVPVSGGRDSAYALYYAKRVLGLKPLAVHNDNDFETETATSNLDKMTEILNVPLIRIKSKRELAKKAVVEKFKMNAHFGAGLVVSQTCEICEYGFEAAAYNTARKNGIKLVIWGNSSDESTASYHSLNSRFVPSKWQRLLSPGAWNLFMYKYYYTKLKKEYGPRFPGEIKEISLYDYIKWDRKIIVDTIKKELQWSAPKDSPTTWRVDCHLVPLVNYLTEKAYGVSKIELGFSSMVRSGKMDRDEAIRQAEQIKENTDVSELKKLLKELNIPNAAIDKVL